MPDSPPAADNSLRWTAASQGVRKTAQWLATALGAIGGVVFGAGPLVSTKADITAWGHGRWVLFFAGALVGIGGLLIVLRLLVAALLPRELTLNTLPDELVCEINDAPQDYLPSGCLDLADFKFRLTDHTTRARELRSQAAQTSIALTKQEFEREAVIQEDNRDVYLACRAQIYAQAKYMEESKRLQGTSVAISFAVGSFAAVVGGAVFTLLLHAPPHKTPAAKAVPEPAFLIPLAGPSVDALWRRLNLDVCSPGGHDAGVPVFVLSTAAGETAWKVRTLGQPAGCTAYVFSVTSDEAKLVRAVVQKHSPSS